MRTNTRKGPKWIMPVVIASLAVSLLVNLALALTLFHRAETPPAAPEARPPLPCAAIPIKLVLEDPACADKLLRAMNVTNVRVLPYGSASAGHG